MQDSALEPARPQASTQTDGLVPWRAIAVLIAVLSVFALNGGFMFPALTFVLDARGFSATVVGAVGSAGAIGYIVGSAMAPFIAAAFGLRRTAVVALVTTACMIFSFAVVPPVLAWYPMRFVHGIATTILFVCGESALIAIAPRDVRGRILGAYTAINSAFFAAGSGVVGVLGFNGLWPYLLVAVVIGLLAIPMASLGKITPDSPATPWRHLLRSVATIPMLLIVICAWGWIDGATLNLWGVYAIKSGVSPRYAAWLLSLGAIGNIFLQFPIGWLADHLPRRWVLAGLAAAGCASSLCLMALDFSGLPMMVNLLLLGSVGFGTFTVALITLGDVLTGTALVAANAAFGLCWGIGDFAGAGVTGALMDVVGPNAFPLALAVGFLVQCAAVILLPLRSGVAGPTQQAA